MNISKPISTASRLRATFTSSAAPERAGKPIHATLSLDPGLHRRLKLAAARGACHERTGVLVDRVELSRVGGR